MVFVAPLILSRIFFDSLSVKVAIALVHPSVALVDTGKFSYYLDIRCSRKELEPDIFIKFHWELMNTMCHACGSEKTPLDSGYHCKICHHPICQECERRDNCSALDDEYPVRHCKSCLEKYGKESLRMDGLSPYITPLVSPALSLSSYGSCISSFGN